MRLTTHVASLILFTAVSARAEEFRGSLPAELAEAAKQILAVMDDVKQPRIEVGQFIPVGSSPANGGPGLRLELIQALEAQRAGVVQADALLAINGKFLIVDDPEDAKTAESRRLQAERITLNIDDKTTGDTVKPISVFVRRLRDIATIEGTTVSLDPHADAREQGQDIRQHQQKPLAFIDGTKIRATADSPFTLQVGVKPLDAVNATAKFRDATLEHGYPYVAIDKGELYELSFHNGSREEVAISVKIDGIDSFTFSDDRHAQTHRPLYTHYIVPHGETLVIPGWLKTIDPKRHDNYLSFLVTEYGQGAASQFTTQSQGQIGVITVHVSKSHLPGSGRAKSSAETGFGPPIKANLKSVERQIDPPHEFISVRYLR